MDGSPHPGPRGQRRCSGACPAGEGVGTRLGIAVWAETAKLVAQTLSLVGSVWPAVSLGLKLCPCLLCSRALRVSSEGCATGVKIRAVFWQGANGR